MFGSGGTIYNYADNIIKGIVQEPDVDVRTRKIMESTVNLVFVYAFADFYLKQVCNDKAKLMSERDPAKLNFSDFGADVVLECTGAFLTEESCQAYIDNGVKKVVMSECHFSMSENRKIWK